MKAPDETMRDIQGAIYTAMMSIVFAPGVRQLTPDGVRCVRQALETLSKRVAELMRLAMVETEPEATDGQ
jgi:hypothetical protein